MVTLLTLSVCVNLILFLILFFYVRKLYQTRNKFKSIRTRLSDKEKVEKRHKSEVETLKEQVESITTTDSITGLVTKSILIERVNLAITQSKRHNMIFALMYMNLNEFKMMQSAVGIEASDEILKKTAERIKSTLRELDVVARFHSDDFVILLPQLSKSETAAYVAKRIIKEIEKPFSVNNQQLFVAASIGISLYPNDADNVNMLLKNSELALHQAKHLGQSIFQFYKKDMQVKSDRNLLIRAALKKPKVENGFKLFYQPIVNIEEKRIDGMQVSLYWEQEDLGRLSLKDFLKQAEETGAIENIGKWMLRNACQQLYQWRLDGFKFLNIFIPISIKQLENPHFVYDCSQILKEFQIELSSLIFEIPESDLAVNSDLSEKSLLMLNEIGVQACVSDFGSGNMVLWKLKDFHVGNLKISNVITRNVAISKDMVSIVKMIQSLSTVLDFRVFAAEVHFKKQAEKLKELGCVLMQGDLFNPPIEAKYFTKELEKDILDF